MLSDPECHNNSSRKRLSNLTRLKNDHCSQSLPSKLSLRHKCKTMELRPPENKHLG